jgi:hypothetical protein
MKVAISPSNHVLLRPVLHSTFFWCQNQQSVGKTFQNIDAPESDIEGKYERCFVITDYRGDNLGWTESFCVLEEMA